MVAIFFSCKKTDNNILASAAENEVTVKNGVVTFPTTADYLAAIDNKSKKQQRMFTTLKEKNFVALRSRPIKQPAITGTGINSFTNAFDTTLYSEYLLGVLNQDKICSINGYLVKVDMDNVFCSVIDETLYASETGDLRNNVFTNPHVMTFVHPDEPVLEVLTRMRNNELTWAQYQDSLARKGGQGICFKKGAKAEKQYTTIPVGPAGNEVVAVSEYNKYFLHFELLASGYAKFNWVFSGSLIEGKYEYVGACKGSGKGTFRIRTGEKPDLLRYLVYSGGSALSVRKLETITTGYTTIKAIARVGY